MFGLNKNDDITFNFEPKLTTPAIDIHSNYSDWLKQGFVNIASTKKKEETSNDDTEKEKEEWIWVEGYKGTNADMTCRDFKYELNKQYDMPEDKPVLECSSGFHLCMKLEHVFNHYDIGDYRRFFKVRALVRKKDVANYDMNIDDTISFVNSKFMLAPVKQHKLVAKSIELLRELTVDEIFEATKFKDWSREDKTLALQIGIDGVKNKQTVIKLHNLGYSMPFAEYIVEKNKVKVATAVASQSDLSMDMKCLIIFHS